MEVKLFTKVTYNVKIVKQIFKTIIIINDNNRLKINLFIKLIFFNGNSIEKLFHDLSVE